jgi:hypothetical protein
MEELQEIQRALGRIEARLDKLPERVSQLEFWQAWLKGGWAALLAAYMYLVKSGFPR